MTTSTGALLRFESIDDYLGSPHGRFFGSGYRRAMYDVRDVQFSAGPMPSRYDRTDRCRVSR